MRPVLLFFRGKRRGRGGGGISEMVNGKRHGILGNSKQHTKQELPPLLRL